VNISGGRGGSDQPRSPGAGTQVFALLGDPISHSLSPDFQNAAFRAYGLDAVYIALRCAASELGGLMRGFAMAGGGGNVTLPHKEAAARFLDQPSEAVRRTGACNTFWGSGGELHGDNTDVEGFRRALEHLRGEDATPLRRVAILGAGGAARAVLTALLDGDVEEILIVNRTRERAEELVRSTGDLRVRAGDWSARGAEPADLLVNATRVGLHPSDPLPRDPGTGAKVGGVLDLVYRREGTPLVKRAREVGIPAEDGSEMLIQQGAAAFELWTGREAPIGAMRVAMGGRAVR